MIEQELAENDKRENAIGKVLGLLEETHRNKDWILQELMKHNLNLQLDPSMNSHQILSSCPVQFLDLLLQTLQGDDISIPEDVQTKIYHWFFSDIVAGSNPSIPTRAQVKKILVLNELISRTDAFVKRDPTLTIILPTGDGMAIGFGDSPERPVLLSVELHKALYEYNKSKRGKEKLLLRIGIESGPIYFVKDLEGKENVWGPGIMLTRRVMDLAGDMQIFAATRVADELVRISPKYNEMLHFVQAIKTKYGEKINLYNIYGDGFGEKSVKQKQKETRTKETTSFAFDKIQIRVDIQDVKSMKTHHSWTWDMTNVSKEPRFNVFYFIDGQVEKDFDSLNVKVTDQKSHKRLKIGQVSVNRPLRKEFYVLLNKPVLPRQKLQPKMEYDWEVPQRVLTFRFPFAIKKFEYTCMVPYKIDIKSRILKVDPDTGQKVHANPPPTVKKIGQKIAITWTKSNIKSQDAYQFQW